MKKQIKLNGVTMDAEEARKVIADLQAQLDAPEPVEFWEGQLVEVYDSNFLGVIKRFNRKSGTGCFDMQCTHWNYCRPLQDPLVLQFKPHKPGDPMPCEEMDAVKVINSNGFVSQGDAYDFDWSDRRSLDYHIIGWMPADGWGGK